MHKLKLLTRKNNNNLEFVDTAKKIVLNYQRIFNSYKKIIKFAIFLLRMSKISLPPKLCQVFIYFPSWRTYVPRVDKESPKLPRGRRSWAARLGYGEGTKTETELGRRLRWSGDEAETEMVRE